MRILRDISTPHETTNFSFFASECMRPSAEKITAKELQIHVDGNPRLPSGFDLTWLHQALQKMITLAVERSPNQSEIQLTACRVEDGVEFEVADSGDTPHDFSTAFRHNCSMAFGPAARELLATVQSRGAQFWGSNCPQGGMAWTLRLPFHTAIAKAA